MRVVGIDIGSRDSKIVMTSDGEIVYKNSFSTLNFYKNHCKFDEKLIFNSASLGLEADIFISTGYGRNNTDLSNFKPINEIKAHVYGVMKQNNLKDFLMLEIGGQDVKAAKVERGIITDVELNDKCAASCGRFLENMASLLEVPFEYMASYHENPVSINSTCAVFSESEVISKVAEGVPVENICAGVNYSLYTRIRPLLKKFKSSSLVLCGGVAKNRALIHYLQNDFSEIIIPQEPQFNGAIGCCRYGETVVAKKLNLL